MSSRTITFDTASDAVTNANMVINTGASFENTFTVNTPAGSAFDLTGYSGSAQVAKHVGAAATATFTVGFTSAFDGKIKVSMSSTDTRTLSDGRHYYDVLVSLGSTVYRIVEGSIDVRQGISSAP